MEQKLSTKYFISKFRLDQENYEFNREHFLTDLNTYFTQILEAERKISKETKDGFNYKKFKNCVDQVEKKFWSISNKKVGLPFTNTLWSAFFAIYIIPLRRELFPEVQQFIESKKVIEDFDITENITSNTLLGRYFLGTSSNGEEVNITRITKTVPPRGKKKEGYYKFINDQTPLITLSTSQIIALVDTGEVKLIDAKTHIITYFSKMF